MVWPLPRSLATTYGISVDVFSSPYLDVSVQAVPHIYLFDSVYVAWLLPSGFPHSEICGSKCVCHSPQLIAACHVLLRLLMPRHSPCALISLTSNYVCSLSWLAKNCIYPLNCISAKFLFHIYLKLSIFLNFLPLCCFSCTLFSFQGASFQILFRIQI